MMEDPIFTSVGLFIIDDNHYPKSWDRPLQHDIIGGGALYAIVGARIVAGPIYGKRVSAIVDKGSDFPSEVQMQIELWGTNAIFRLDESRLTTRGANIYTEDGLRKFVYKTPKKRVEGVDIVNTGLVGLQSFHFCCAVDRCEQMIDLFHEKRGAPPLVIFEPFPDICVPENYQSLCRMLHKVDVFSPNLDEAAAFLGKSSPTTEIEIAKIASAFNEHQTDGGVVLRCGALGCYIKKGSIGIMLPAYHVSQDAVVDVTGGGNSFCGAFITALVLYKDWVAAGALANVASGCVIEALGVPTRMQDTEVWNGQSVIHRIDNYFEANAAALADWRWVRERYNHAAALPAKRV